MKLTTALLSAMAAIFVSDDISQITSAKAGDSASSSASSRAASKQMEVMPRRKKKADESAISIESNPVKLKSITIVPGSGKAITAPSKDRNTKKDRDDR